MEFSHNRKRSRGDKTSDRVDENDPDVSSENLLDFSSPEIRRDYVRKSRTHDCVMNIPPENGEGAPTPGMSRHSGTVNSTSLPVFAAPRGSLRENRDLSSDQREIIDFRNLAPQVPFVPSVAKSVPKKRIFLRKPKKTIKDLFVHKKSSREKATSPRTPSRERGPTTERTRKSSKCRDSRATRKASDEFSDFSSDERANVCEDAVSLKSFGSQAGCGEIFADEEYLVSLDGNPAVFQGGTEQLASPAHPEVLDLFGMWETINRSLLLSLNQTSTPISISSSSLEIAYPVENVPSKNTSEGESRTATPKSENQESTSDEGYCDCLSAEDLTGRSLTPVFTRKIPRDTYSGDALYELFYDPSEAEITPVFDDDPDLPSSGVGLPSPDLPLSMYSFHIGSEENLAPPLSVDLISQDFLQSNWVGKDCLLKLCDTEISLTMGIVNWMKHRTLKENEAELRSPEIITRTNGDVCLEESVHTTDLRKTSLRASRSKENLKLSRPCQVDVGHLPVDTVKHQEIQPRTPTSHVCFRIFNINSPSTPCKDLESPAGRSPGSGTSSVFVLAIKKESLCESCKASLKHGAEEFHLCPSCTSFIEQIKTSELWPPPANLYRSRFTGSPQALLPSPSIASDISILSLVKQCANQMSSLKLNQHQHPSETRPVANQGRDNHPRKYRNRKSKKKSSVTGNAGDDPNAKVGLARSPSLLESEKLTSDKSETRPRDLQTNPSKDTETSRSSRPTSLPLTSATSCRFSKNEHHKTQERSRPDRKASGTRTGLSDGVTTDEKKMRRRCRMKK